MESNYIYKFEKLRRNEDLLNRIKVTVEAFEIFIFLVLPGAIVVSMIFLGDVLYGSDRDGGFLLLLIIKVCVQYTMRNIEMTCAYPTARQYF